MHIAVGRCRGGGGQRDKRKLWQMEEGNKTETKYSTNEASEKELYVYCTALIRQLYSTLHQAIFSHAWS